MVIMILLLYFIFIIMSEKNTIKGINSVQSREWGSSQKRSSFPLFKALSSAETSTKFALKNLQKNLANLKEKLDYHLKNSLRNNTEVESFLHSCKTAIEEAKNLGIDTNNYERELLYLEKKIYCIDIANEFLFATDSSNYSLKIKLKKAFRFNISNEEINSSIINVIENELQTLRKEQSVITWTFDDEMRWKETYYDKDGNKKIEIIENRKDHQDANDKLVSHWETRLNDLKANPVDFTKFLDPQAWNKE